MTHISGTRTPLEHIGVIKDINKYEYDGNMLGYATEHIEMLYNAPCTGKRAITVNDIDYQPNIRIIFSFESKEDAMIFALYQS